MKPCSVLLIEDDSNDMTLLIRQWHNGVTGCSLVVATSMLEVTEVFRRRREFKCICLDLRLIPDDQTGLGTLKVIRDNAPDVLIVVVSGTVTQAHRELFKLLGGIYVCRKTSLQSDLEPLFKLIR